MTSVSSYIVDTGMYMFHHKCFALRSGITLNVLQSQMQKTVSAQIISVSILH